jgi:hypothetical protein
MALDFEFHPHSRKQEELIYSDADLTIAGTGTQWGKSIAGSLWMLRKIAISTDPADRFLLMAPNYKIMQQSMQPYFLNLMKITGLGEFKKVDAAFNLFDGRVVYLRTETDPDSIVGIPNLKAYWLDEAGKVSLYFHENIQARAASVGAKGLYTTSPYSRNWLWKNYIKIKEKGGLEDIKLIQAASWENPYHTLANHEKRRKMVAQMDPRRFEMLFGGQWGKQAGLVYDCFDDVQNICAPFRLPNGTIFYGGIDWGHTEPFVLVIRAITPDLSHYQVSEFYKTGMTIIDQMKVVKSKMAVYNIKHFYCGHERPENIALFNQNGIPASGVPEKNIQVGTDLHYELIKTCRYKVFEGSSPYTLDEYDTYHYPEPEDLKPDEESDDQLPVGQNDHCMSANRFVTLRTYKSGILSKPFVPDEQLGDRIETQEARLRRLMRSKAKSKQSTESWS